MRRILIVQRSAALDGSAHSGLLLADGLREAGWSTHVAFGFEGPIIDRYDAAEHETHVIPHDNWLRRGHGHQFLKDAWLEWRAAAAFEAIIEEIRPEVIYLNTVVSLAGALAARRKSLPCIWHLREMFSEIGGEMRAPKCALPLIRRIILYHADRLVANSMATARNMLGEGADKATIIPNAVRAEFFQENKSSDEARAALGLPIGSTIIGVPGTLRPMKGHPFFFDAIAPLLSRRNEVRVAVTGQGTTDFTAQLNEQVRTLGIEDQVRFLGWVEDMPAFYRSCDLVCIPSRAEPFGRTAIEAFAVGTPVVATAVGGLRDIVTDGETGVLVAYGDEEGLRRGVLHLLEDSSRRRMLAASARCQAEKKYCESIYKQRSKGLVEKLYKSK